MQRVLRHRLLPALSVFLALAAFAILPFSSVANAASSKTVCEPNEGGNYCHLEISAPESVPAGQPFTVKVAVMTGFEDGVVAKSDFCASKVQVTLDVLVGETDTFYFAKASGGIATFIISVPSAGSYSLDAHVDLGEASTDSCGNHYIDGFAEFTAVDVQAGQPIAPCPPDVVCTQVTNNGAGGGSAATLFADNGEFSDVFFVPLLAGEAEACGIVPADPINPVLSFTYLGSSTKTIVFALSPNLVTKGIGRYNVCWTSSTPFTPLGGGPQVTTGLLPDCSKNATGPCVLFRTSTQYNGAFIGVSAPASDPRGFAG